MSTPSQRTAAVVVAVATLGLAGWAGWVRYAPPTTKHVEMKVATSGDEAGKVPVATGPAAAVDPAPPAASPPSAPPAKSATADGPVPSFDIVRVEPSGDALLAGRSRPDSTVALVDKGKVVAETKADSSGNFVMTPPTLKPGGYSLSLREGQGAAARDSTQNVVVSVPPSKSEPVVVAMAEPGKATALLSKPPEIETEQGAPQVGSKPVAPVPAASTPAASTPTAAKPAEAAPKLAIRSVELENGSGLFASGVAPPGRDVRLYLNDSRVADVAAAPKGDWTVSVRKGLAAGHYAVRADMLKRDQHVEARVEVPFDVPAPVGDTAAPVAQSSPSPRAARVGQGASTEPAKAVETSKTVESSKSVESVKTIESSRTIESAGPTASGKTDAAAADAEPGPGHAVVDELQTELVARGDNLWRISRKRLGHGTRYTLLYAANVSQIRDPNLIYPGQVFVVPHE